MRLPRPIVIAIAAAVGGLVAPAAARAHDMNATVEVRADAVRVVVYFEDDLPAELATVRVTDETGTEVAAGSADERGVWSFPRPAPGAYRLTAKCMGHAAAVPFSIAPDPDAAPVAYTGERMNKTVGLTVGAGGLLGASGLFWLVRRRR